MTPRRGPRRHRRHRLDARSTGRPRSPAPPPTPSSTGSSAPAYLHPSRPPIARGRDHRRSTPPRPRRSTACSPCSPTSTRRGSPPPTDASWRSCSPTESHYRGQFVGAVVAESAEIAARGRRRSSRRLRRRSRTTSSCAPTTRASTRRRRSTRASPPTPRRATSRPRWRRRRSRVDETYTHADGAQQPDGAARHHRSRCGRTAASRCTTPPRASHAVRSTLAEAVRARPRAGPGDRPARRRRLRLQGAAARPRCARRAWPRRRCRAGPVKLALTRQQMFFVVGYRTPTIQRIRLGAGADGRLTAIAHDVVEQTSRSRSSPSRPRPRRG